ncbi:MAG: DNA helicase RecQ [Caldilineaceae bacterium]|nr:DNA helicase RecQ [Caldilineaceae bacterium]
MNATPLIPIYTIGHEDRSLAALAALLQQYAIAFVIDVRPRAETSVVGEGAPSGLAAALAQQGIRYVDLREALGGPPDAAQAAAYQQAIRRLQTAFQQQQRVALLGEALSPSACHRSQVIGTSLVQLQIPVAHIDEAGALQWQAVEDALAAPIAPPQPISATGPVTGERPLAILARVFGYTEFRPLQAQIIENLIAQRDTLVIMPTGGGKSLCYQLPALHFAGLTLVVSPLIALMQDQVEQLLQLGVSAAFLNSTLTGAVYSATIAKARTGQLKLLYMAPETLLRPDILQLLAECHLAAIAIDEAHCISQWGHDFRPEYRQLVAVRQRFPQAVCVALTATATPRVQQDIRETLNLRSENAFVASFDRPNLFIGVQPKVDTARQILAFLAEHADQTGIIYCSTQRHVDDLAALLQSRGITALPYHAGLDKTTREQNQRAFMVDDVRVMVATVAFGMGVDKPDVRFVLHVDLPQDVENYYQQIGRAGRDGDRADCLLLFGYGDVHTIQHFIREGAESERAGRLQRLQLLVNWAEANRCRRQPLLAYFGEEYTATDCGMCDHCARTDADLVDLTVPAQKFLSCVVRTGEKFGAGHVIGVLRGSLAQSILKWSHEKLSTHGIGQEYSESSWKHFVQQFLQQGLLNHELAYGTLTLTEKGWAVLRGSEQVWGISPAGPATGPAAAPPPYELQLAERLRHARKQLADAQGVAPYMIFADRSLQEMATYLPHSAASFALIHGVGRAKVERYGDHFLELIRTYCQERGLTERPNAATPPPARVSLGKTRSDEVGELFAAGRSLAELADHFQVKRQTVITNLVKYCDDGHALDGARLQVESTSPAALQTAALQAFAELGDQYLKPVFEQLGQQVDYDELHLLRLVYRLLNR